jgi:hypothetical protein
VLVVPSLGAARAAILGAFSARDRNATSLERAIYATPPANRHQTVVATQIDRFQVTSPA